MDKKDFSLYFDGKNAKVTFHRTTVEVRDKVNAVQNAALAALKNINSKYHEMYEHAGLDPNQPENMVKVVNASLTMQEYQIECTKLEDETNINICRVCIDAEKMDKTYSGIHAAIESANNSEFWQEQDTNTLRDIVEFFRVAARIGRPGSAAVNGNVDGGNSQE